MKQYDNVLIADNGMVLKRKADGMIYDSEVSLGNTYYIGGRKLEEPHMDTAEDFEEVSITEIPTE